MDREVRGNVAAEEAASLRAPEVADRWYFVLVSMKKSVESTIAAKTSEDKQQRLALISAAEDAGPGPQSLEVSAAWLPWDSNGMTYDRSYIEWLQKLPADAEVVWHSSHLTREEPWSAGFVYVKCKELQDEVDCSWVWTINWGLDEDDPDVANDFDRANLWNFQWPPDLCLYRVWDDGNRDTGPDIETVVTRCDEGLTVEQAEHLNKVLATCTPEAAVIGLQGWSAESVTEALQHWVDVQAGRSDLRFVWDPDGADLPHAAPRPESRISASSDAAPGTPITSETRSCTPQCGRPWSGPNPPITAPNRLLRMLMLPEPMTRTLLPATFPDLGVLIEDVGLYAKARRAPNTIRAQDADWRSWNAFCTAYGFDLWAATPAVASLYISAMARNGRKWSTIRRHLATISRAYKLAGHPDPTTDEKLRDWCKGVRRIIGTHVDQRPPISVDVLRAMCAPLPDTNRGRRDRVTLTLGFTSGLRRQELVDLNVPDVVCEDERAVIAVAKSKADQDRHGRLIMVPAAEDPSVCPVRAVREWLDRGALSEGPLLRPVNRWDQVHPHQRLQGRAVADIVRRVAHLAGVADADALAAHSMRSGLATSLIDANVGTWQATRATGHASERAFSQYVRLDARVGEAAVRQLGL